MIQLRPLRSRDVPAALTLSTQAGWNQLAADWQRLLTLAPDGCFGGWVGDMLVATGTVLPYDQALGWIGMILVHTEHRRQGYGRALFLHALNHARQSGLAAVGLDATDQGRPLYRQYDFADVVPVVRWQGVLRPAEVPPEVKVLEGAAEEEQWDALCALDARACGLDRRALLRQLRTEPGVAALLQRDAAGRARGYALLRPGRTGRQLGPVVAGEASGLEALLRAAATQDAGSILLDVIAGPDRRDVAPVLQRHGLQPQRRLMRMRTHGPADLLTGPSVVAAAGLELG